LLYWSNNKNAYGDCFPVSDMSAQNKAICTSNISLNQKKHFPWKYKESNDHISFHLLWLILSSVFSVVA